MAANAQPKSNPDNRAPKPLPKSSPPKPALIDNLWIGTFALLLITLVVYLVPLQKAGFIWDDDNMLTNNEFVHAPDGLHSFWFTDKGVDYLPLTMSVLWYGWHAWGMNPLNYHVLNLVLHALSIVLLWRILRRLNLPGAWWAALLFSLHPVNVESVAWIAELKNTLSMFFFALALWCYLRFDEGANAQALSADLTADNQPRAWPLNSSLKWYFFALVAFALALLSKQAIVMLPAVILGCAWWKRQRISLDDCLRSVPFFALSAAAAYVAIWFQYNRSIGEIRVYEVDLPTRIAAAGLNVWFYLYKALLPLNLTFVYPHWLETPGLKDFLGSHSPTAYLPGIAYLLVLGVLWFFRKSWGRPLLAVCGYFGLMLLPVLGFFKIFFFRYSLVADHYQYYSLIAVTALLAALVVKYLRGQATYVLGALALVFAFLTIKQCAIYQNQPVLWTDTLHKNPRCWMAQGNWAYFLEEQAEALGRAGRQGEASPFFEGALEHFRQGVAIKPDDYGSFYNMGVCAMGLQRPKEAIQYFRQVVHINPIHIDALDALGWYLATTSDNSLRSPAEAVNYSKRAVALSSDRGDYDMKLESLAAAYAANRQFDEAVRTQEKAMEIAQHLGKSPNDLGVLTEHLALYKAKIDYRAGDR